MRGVTVSPREILFLGSATGRSGEYLQSPSTLELDISSLDISFFNFSKLYLTNRGLPASDKP
jgi:hypothetical protein